MTGEERNGKYEIYDQLTVPDRRGQVKSLSDDRMFHRRGEVKVRRAMTTQLSSFLARSCKGMVVMCMRQSCWDDVDSL